MIEMKSAKIANRKKPRRASGFPKKNLNDMKTRPIFVGGLVESGRFGVFTEFSSLSESLENIAFGGLAVKDCLRGRSA